ncbi:tricarballylate utilization 4Fe-4S protein TcuB [Telmatospirillum siberiense]|uniref:CitB family transcriptional regulator n=1 Tax=Telmatospirillum siberiense TaxID=382514 RepID=A0A2N3Q1S0_9PROT|nr:tricarballylate utilization 4Fe-4S protein TcuB [Telmatospirillum siberiense]PKU26596.1 CitB family transcriptional regulator [Telmatospirillum siberiense]
MRTTDSLLEARRELEICNACRYCEGFCAVFPAMELRRVFNNGDLSYLANLCHNCRGCYYACQYAPPHEFGINMPRTFAELRAETYEEYAWPGFLAGAFRRNGAVIAILTALCLAGVLIAAALFQSPAVLFGSHAGPGAFYAVIPHGVMVAVAGVTGLFALFALLVGFIRFWSDIGGRAGDFFRPAPLARALGDILTLRNLGEEHGCNDQDEAFSSLRRRFHHALFYGFLACFASTATATFYEYGLSMISPFHLFSLPVVLGTVGGIGIVVGCAGMLWLKMASDQAPGARRLLGGDVAFVLLLALSSVSGLTLLALRGTSGMGITLALHLGFVLTLFLSLPYSKFVHAIYRAGALLRYALERRS